MVVLHHSYYLKRVTNHFHFKLLPQRRFCRFVAQQPDSFFVKHHPVKIATIIFGKTSSANHTRHIGRQIVVVYRKHLYQFYLWGITSIRPIGKIVGNFHTGNSSRNCHVTYIRPLLQTFGETLHAQRQSLGERRIFNDQNAGIQIRFGLTLHVTDLLKHSKRTCNQNKRSQELNNNQRLSDPVASLSVQQFTAHNLRRTDSDHQPGRIKPYNQRTHDNHSGYNPPKSGLHKYVVMNEN